MVKVFLLIMIMNYSQVMWKNLTLYFLQNISSGLVCSGTDRTVSPPGGLWQSGEVLKIRDLDGKMGQRCWRFKVWYRWALVNPRFCKDEMCRRWGSTLYLYLVRVSVFVRRGFDDQGHGGQDGAETSILTWTIFTTHPSLPRRGTTWSPTRSSGAGSPPLVLCWVCPDTPTKEAKLS